MNDWHPIKWEIIFCRANFNRMIKEIERWSTGLSYSSLKFLGEQIKF